VVSSQNAAKAYILGYSTTLTANLTPALSVAVSYNNTRGRVKSSPYETPLDHIPPAFGRVGLKYRTSKIYAELFSLFNGWKPKEEYSGSGEDNYQYAPTDGMKSTRHLPFRPESTTRLTCSTVSLLPASIHQEETFSEHFG
jgi:hemoglobin/transferrin/lactoferrin receptor protein